MPAMEIFRTAFGFVLGRMGKFFSISWLYIALLAALFTYQDMSDAGGAGLGIGQALVDALFAFLWHRYYLLGRENFSLLGVPKGASKEKKKAFAKLSSRFLLRSIGFGIGVALVVVVSALIIFSGMGGGDLDEETGMAMLTLVALGVIVLLSPILFRFLPYFPALAVGNMDVRIADAWKLTRGKTMAIWRSFMLVFIPLGVLTFAIMILAGAIYEWQTPSELVRAILANTIFATISIFTLAVGVTANSEIYRRLSGFKAPAITSE